MDRLLELCRREAEEAGLGGRRLRGDEAEPEADDTGTGTGTGAGSLGGNPSSSLILTNEAQGNNKRTN